MRRYKAVEPFDVALKLLKPTTTMVKGVAKKAFPDPSKVENVFFGSIRTYGGTENISNEVYTVFDTAVLDTWFDPEITSDCQVYMCETGETWEIVSRPENIGMRHQYMQVRLKKVGGKP